ncbi:GD19122 [Drosophila simulans]|uniref:GD19122 n=1 Tax=Drosophila simulans TaxID=7240 RepID=B4QWF1_DROSI|nr:GD19122 [Drosophila simulans]
MGRVRHLDKCFLFEEWGIRMPSLYLNHRVGDQEPTYPCASPCSRFKRRGNKTGNATSAKLLQQQPHQQQQQREASSGVARTSAWNGTDDKDELQRELDQRRQLAKRI